MKKEIKFKDLSPWLKTLVVYGFISFGFSIIGFVYGFITG